MKKSAKTLFAVRRTRNSQRQPEPARHLERFTEQLLAERLLAERLLAIDAEPLNLLNRGFQDDFVIHAGKSNDDCNRESPPSSANPRSKLHAVGRVLTREAG